MSVDASEARQRPAPPPLHVAVWEGDVDQVQALLHAECPPSGGTDAQKAALKELLETKDVRGNSALHLAVRVVQPAQRAIVKLLLDHDASVSSRNLEGWSCAHDAALCDDEFLLAQLYLRGEKQVLRSLEQAQQPFLQALETLPDFEAEIFVEAHSWVPMVSAVLPSDTIRIWKRGTQLRVDSALKGLDGIKWKRGNMSHLYLGKDRGERAGHAVVMDHGSRAFYDVLEAAQDSSVGNMDLALQVSLSTAMSSSSMDATHLEFVKHKDVKAEGKSDDDMLQLEQEAEHNGQKKTKSRSRQRRSPWPGTTYRMHKFSMDAQFRPVVNPDRKLKQLPTDKDTPLEELQQFVDHLTFASSKSKSKTKKNKKARQPSSGPKSHNNSSVGTGTDNGSSMTPKTLKLEKGRKIEMHLDVAAGDSVRWEFMSKSSEFCFVATYYHEDQQAPVCRTDGVKNAAIAGSFQVEHNGSFVLMWMNTQKGFTLDRGGIKITYDVAHIRPTVSTCQSDESSSESVAGPANAVGLASPTFPEEPRTEEQGGSNTRQRTGKLTDEEKCEVFRQLEHLPNPFTTTTAFNDYFMIGTGADDAPRDGESKSGESKKTKSSFFKTYKSKKAQQQEVQSTEPTPASSGGNHASCGLKNTFRSLTLLPSTRRVRKDFEAKVLMTESFPFQLRDFLPIIKFLSSTGEHVKNLDEFFQMKLPPGFPVKFELPMMFTVRVAYTFQKITLHPKLDASLFEIPSDYRQVFTLDEVRS